MKWAHYVSLTGAAKEAFDKGDGTHGMFVVCEGHIASKNPETGKVGDFMLIIRGCDRQPIFEEVK